MLGAWAYHHEGLLAVEPGNDPFEGPHHKRYGECHLVENGGAPQVVHLHHDGLLDPEWGEQRKLVQVFYHHVEIEFPVKLFDICRDGELEK